MLVYAHRADAPDHARHREWLEQVVNGDAPYALSDLVLSGFLRVVTHPAVFRPPTRMSDALSFVEQVRDQPHCVRLMPGARHFGIFAALCRKSGVKGNLVPDAFLAAMAIESGCEWITTDRDFSRFAGLKIRHPFDP